MKKLFIFLTIFVSFNLVALGQDLVTVSGTVTDSDTITWTNGTWSASLVNPRGGQVTFLDTGVPLTPDQYIIPAQSLGSSGTFSQTGVVNNTAVAPAGTTWQFQFCPNATFKCTSLTNITITSNTDLTTVIHQQIVAPRFAATGANTYGYSTVEISPVPVPGGFFWNTLLNETCQWTGFAWQCSNNTPGIPVVNLTQFGGICDYDITTGTGHDDTAAFVAAFTFLESQLAQSSYQSSAALVLPVNKACRVSSEQRIPSSISIYCAGNNSCWIQMDSTLGAQNLFTVIQNDNGTPHGVMMGFSIQGYGSLTTGVAIELLHPIQYTIRDVNIREHGGTGIRLYNSERDTIQNVNLFTIRKPLDIWSSSNEEDLDDIKVVNCGQVNTEGVSPVAPAWYYSRDAINGVQPPANCSGGGTCVNGLTALHPNNWDACVDINDAEDVEYHGPGSNKGNSVSAFKINQSNVHFDKLYAEQTIVNPSILETGAIWYSKLTAAFPATAFSVTVDNVDHQVDSVTTCTDFQGLNSKEVIFPPDYVPFSTASSCLSGIERGQFEITGEYGHCSIPTPSFYSGRLGSINRGLVGGCSGPNGISCVGNAPINWPAPTTNCNAIEGIFLTSPTFISVRDSHIEGINPPASGYTVMIDNSTTLSSSEIVAGAIPDGYQIVGGGNTPQSNGVYDNDTFFTDPSNAGLYFPSAGRFLGHNNSKFTLNGKNTGGILPTSGDTASFKFIGPYYAFGPTIVQAAYYPANTANPTGIEACVSVDSPDEGGTWLSPGCNGSELSVKKVAVPDPAGGTDFGFQYNNSFSFFNTPPVAPQSVPSITYGTSAIPGPVDLEFKEAYVDSVPTPLANSPLGGYPNITFTGCGGCSGGTGYSPTPGPQVLVTSTVSADNKASTGFVLSNGNTMQFNGLSSATYAINDLVTPYQCTSAQGVLINGLTIKLTAASSTSITGTTIHNGLATGTFTDTCNLTKSRCPYWIGLPTTVGGVLQYVGSYVIPGYCLDSPGTNEPIAAYYTSSTATGSGAVGQVTVLGNYETLNAPYTILTTGNATSITIPSPGAPASGIASAWDLWAGLPGNSKLVATNTPLTGGGSNVTLTSIDIAPAFSAGATFAPYDCQINCNAPQRFMLTNNGYELDEQVFMGAPLNYLPQMIFCYQNCGTGFTGLSLAAGLGVQASKFQIGTVSWTIGVGAPGGACVTGSIYSNTTGTAGTTLYDCVATAWVAFASPN